MPSAHPIELRKRVVASYESGEGTYDEVAVWFSLGVATVRRWVQLQREHGDVTPREKGGGTPSPIDAFWISIVLLELPDGNADELTAAYNRRRPKRHRVHVSSMKRALRRFGYVVKKNESGRWSKSDPTSLQSATPIKK